MRVFTFTVLQSCSQPDLAELWCYYQNGILQNYLRNLIFILNMHVSLFLTGISEYYRWHPGIARVLARELFVFNKGDGIFKLLSINERVTASAYVIGC